MESPFLYSCDLWIDSYNEEPWIASYIEKLWIDSYIEEPWTAAGRHPYRVDSILESAAPTRPRVVSIPIHFVGSDSAATASEQPVPIAISQNEIPAVAENLAEESKDPISEEVEKFNGRDFGAEEEEEKRTEEDEGFVMVAAEEKSSFSPTDIESEESDSATSEEAREDSTVASGMQQVLKKVMAASDRLRGWWR